MAAWVGVTLGSATSAPRVAPGGELGPVRPVPTRRVGSRDLDVLSLIWCERYSVQQRDHSVSSNDERSEGESLMALPPSSSSATPPRTRYVVGSAVDAGAAAAGELEDFGFGCHGGVAGRGHRQCTVCGAVLHSGLEGLAGQ